MTGPAAPGRPPSAPEGGRPRRAHRLAAAVVIVGTALASAGTAALVTGAPRPPRGVDVGTLPGLRGTGGPTPGTGTAAPPVRIRIDRIGLDDPLTGLRVQQDGHLGTPADPDQVGWWTDGPRPGDRGAAIVVGHVDSSTGPAAFYRLSALRPGDRISVDRADRTRVTFTVTALRQYDKDTFPDDEVYATTGTPALRLITCGGTYDRRRAEYRANLVVYATRSTPHPAGAAPRP